jgi:hypothetical protein
MIMRLGRRCKMTVGKPSLNVERIGKTPTTIEGEPT